MRDGKETYGDKRKELREDIKKEIEAKKKKEFKRKMDIELQRLKFERSMRGKMRLQGEKVDE